jgi:anaerobic selenocysteine-containing dehydrogenase
MKEFVTVCPRNCYSTCSFRVFTEEGKVKRILPYEGNLATPKGPCLKGLSFIEREFSPSRILSPLRRTQDGTFNRITWNEALTTISEKLLDARKKDGPYSVLFYKGSGYSGLSNDISMSFWRLYGGATTTYGNLCWPAGLEAVRLTLGEVKHNVPWDLARADFIILWGKNSAETNIQEMIHIDKAKKNGAKLVVIDPRRTPTADKADILIRPAPGTDAALALAMARVVIDKGLINSEFINKHVHGFDRFAASLKITPEEAERITGIPAEKIEELAVMAGQSERLTVIAGYGLQRYKNGGQTIRSILTIPIITGMIGRSGCGFNYANMQSYVFDDVKEPLSYYPDPEKDRPFRRTLSMALFGRDFFSLSDPGISVAWIERGNPVIQLPGSSEVIRALRTIPFKVVVDQFITDTAALADIILPAKGIFEQNDVVSSYWHPYIQYKPAVIPSPGEVKPESEIYCLLAQMMKLEPDGHGSLPSPDEYDKWLEGHISHDGTLSKEELEKAPLIARQSEELAYHEMKFDTPSGKIELWSDRAVQLWKVSPLPEYVPPDDISYSHLPFMLMTPNIASRIHSQFGNLEIIKSVTEEPAWEISVADARRMRLKTGDAIRIYNTNGEVSGTVRVSARVKSGSIVFPNGIWLSEGGGVNTLIEPAETDMGYGAAFHNTMVAIEKRSS